MSNTDIIRREFARGHGFRMATSFGYITYYPCLYNSRKCRAQYDYINAGARYYRLVNFDTVARNFNRFTDIII